MQVGNLTSGTVQKSKYTFFTKLHFISDCVDLGTAWSGFQAGYSNGADADYASLSGD